MAFDMHRNKKKGRPRAAFSLASDTGYFACMRIAPSQRMVSLLTYAFS